MTTKTESFRDLLITHDRLVEKFDARQCFVHNCASIYLFFFFYRLRFIFIIISENNGLLLALD